MIFNIEVELARLAPARNLYIGVLVCTFGHFLYRYIGYSHQHRVEFVVRSLGFIFYALEARFYSCQGFIYLGFGLIDRQAAPY